MNFKDIPKKCWRMVFEYTHMDPPYKLVRPDRHNLLKLRRQGHNPVVYIVANEKSPYCGIALLNRARPLKA